MLNQSCSPISPPLSDAPGNKKVSEVSTVVLGPALFVSSPGIVSHSLCMRTWLGSFGLLQPDGRTRQFLIHRSSVRRHPELLTDGLQSLQPLSLHPILSIHEAPAESLLDVIGFCAWSMIWNPLKSLIFHRSSIRSLNMTFCQGMSRL